LNLRLYPRKACSHTRVNANRSIVLHSGFTEMPLTVNAPMSAATKSTESWTRRNGMCSRPERVRANNPKRSDHDDVPSALSLSQPVCRAAHEKAKQGHFQKVGVIDDPPGNSTGLVAPPNPTCERRASRSLHGTHQEIMLSGFRGGAARPESRFALSWESWGGFRLPALTCRACTPPPHLTP
jgi:hypothetical protein